MPISEEDIDATILDRAINDASDQTVRAVLKSICAKSDEARKEAENQLLVSATETESSDKNKRRVPRYAFCVNCEKEFDVTTKTEKNCRYHPEQSEPTGEALFVDNWDECDVDTDEMRENFPECFTFECCEGNLRDNPDGCVTDFHQEQYPGGRPAKRSKAF
ncbi:uncharacterized protein N7479_009256 [Penicillium vulpinum]|uniref:C2H2-type domain-containing protein n=1 Tax=Penicillium vulpinum TaxID=29845 RepID=A0A1V6RVP9_9EURO|nr:uncharacterized protein N7479_009256 [Penicillium vulpinum]KAJ5950843.1 hypothetical protein N7479_009256 [Penicillium vulpinum]OQE05851.1 hypothetical protein PENVUL_c021G04734 [Penicillium vulpinum]